MSSRLMANVFKTNDGTTVLACAGVVLAFTAALIVNIIPIVTSGSVHRPVTREELRQLRNSVANTTPSPARNFSRGG